MMSDQPSQRDIDKEKFDLVLNRYKSLRNTELRWFILVLMCLSFLIFSDIKSDFKLNLIAIQLSPDKYSHLLAVFILSFSHMILAYTRVTMNALRTRGVKLLGELYPDENESFRQIVIPDTFYNYNSRLSRSTMLKKKGFTRFFFRIIQLGVLLFTWILNALIPIVHLGTRNEMSMSTIAEIPVYVYELIIVLLSFSYMMSSLDENIKLAS